MSRDSQLARSVSHETLVIYLGRTVLLLTEKQFVRAKISQYGRHIKKARSLRFMGHASMAYVLFARANSGWSPSARRG